MSHTEEPWRIRCHTCGTPADISEGDDYTIEGADGTLVAFEPRRGDHSLGNDARRAVACVNACVGIETSQLEALDIKGAIDGADDFLRERDEYKEQRDELLAALKSVMHSKTAITIEAARAAISKATGRTA